MSIPLFLFIPAVPAGVGLLHILLTQFNGGKQNRRSDQRWLSFLKQKKVGPHMSVLLQCWWMRPPSTQRRIRAFIPPFYDQRKPSQSLQDKSPQPNTRRTAPISIPAREKNIPIPARHNPHPNSCRSKPSITTPSGQKAPIPMPEGQKATRPSSGRLLITKILPSSLAMWREKHCSRVAGQRFCSVSIQNSEIGISFGGFRRISHIKSQFIY